MRARLSVLIENEIDIILMHQEDISISPIDPRILKSASFVKG